MGDLPEFNEQTFGKYGALVGILIGASVGFVKAGLGGAVLFAAAGALVVGLGGIILAEMLPGLTVIFFTGLTWIGCFAALIGFFYLVKFLWGIGKPG